MPVIFDSHGIISGPDAPTGHHRIIWNKGHLVAVKGSAKWTAELPKPEGKNRVFRAGDYTIRTAGCKCSCGPTCKAPRRSLIDA